MIVVLDTNVVLQARSPRHAFHRILQAWKDGTFTLAVTTDILLEYEEVITAKTGAARWRELAAFLDAVAKSEGNLITISPSFRFRLIAADADDDKFADCAIAAEADYIVTEDAHFNVLRGSGHKPLPIAPAEFIARLGEAGQRESFP